MLIALVLAVVGTGESALAAPAPTSQPIPRALFIATMDADFKRMDTNQDGKLTRLEVEKYQKDKAIQEAQARRKALFASLDADHNGQLSYAEFLKLTMPMEAVNAAGTVARLDANHDNMVSLIEYRAGTLVGFDRLDADKDGIVTAAEMHNGGVIK